MLHTLYSVVKVFLWTSGKSIWLADVEPCTVDELINLQLSGNSQGGEGQETDQCVPFDFRDDLVQDFRTTIKYVSICLVLVSCVLALAIYKRRGLVDFILYLELLHLTFLTTIPSPNNNYTDLYTLMVHYWMFTAFYTNKGGQIIVSVLSQTFATFFILPIIFMKPLTFGSVISKVSLAVALFVICMTLAIMLEYIGKLHARMKNTNTENMHLLDGMHEGLLIVDKAQKGVMFCNRPAQKLLNGAINRIGYELDNNGVPINPLLEPKIFQPVKIAVKDQVQKFQQMINEQNKQA